MEKLTDVQHWRLIDKFEKIKIIYCGNCKLDVEKHGEHCRLCSHSTKGNEVKIAYIKKRC